MSFKNRGGGGVEAPSRSVISRKWTLFLCIGSFCAGMFFTARMWTVPETKGGITRTTAVEAERLNLVSEGCNTRLLQQKDVKLVSKDVSGKFLRHIMFQTLDKTISNLEMELAAAKATQESILSGAPISEDIEKGDLPKKRKYLVGEKRKKLEEEKGIIMRFVIGHGATLGGILDRAIEAEDRKHGDFLRLDHVEGYLELSAKTKTYFATAVKLWDAEYYVKVDDDVHVNIGTLAETLARHRKKPRVYIGGVRYHEPEYWKFGETGNKYFRHATGQIYAISKDLASYISVNQHVLHKYANEDVSLGAWFIGLDVQHIDDRRLCCGTPPDCEWKAQAGNVCVASFDWTCSGICRLLTGRRWASVLYVKFLILSLESTDIHMIYTKGEVNREKEAGKGGNTKERGTEAQLGNAPLRFCREERSQTACKKQAAAHHSFLCYLPLG
ncbi:Beta-1,3-galactosyltransferase 2 [Datura stramonium]|uniref:Hexosyltransferase n=2 Tax=Magnoliopsida TaxID=3398 RepID=A0ABS8TAX3_DATST|nr:Beta-1,3-galactosyltransferase 2 [Datura stramonium]